MCAYKNQNKMMLHVLILVSMARLAAAAGGISIRGRVVVQDPLSLAALPLDTHAILFGSNADNTHRRRKAFVDLASGSFRFDDVMDGVYVLNVEATPFVFSAVKVTVDRGALKEALASDMGDAPLPLDLDEGIRMVPLGRHSFFEQRGKFSLWAFVKTPYGAMIFFALFSLVVMPYLKVDPEEYRQMKRDIATLTSSEATELKAKKHAKAGKSS